MIFMILQAHSILIDYSVSDFFIEYYSFTFQIYFVSLVRVRFILIKSVSSIHFILLHFTNTSCILPSLSYVRPILSHADKQLTSFTLWPGSSNPTFLARLLAHNHFKLRSVCATVVCHLSSCRGFSWNAVNNSTHQTMA